jgi:putative phosphoribosyl transferase
LSAGQRLANKLETRFFDAAPVVLALPRGGVPVAAPIAAALNAPLDVVLVRKLRAPFQPELAVGAIVDGDAPETFLNEDIIRMYSVSDDYLREESARQLATIEARRALYLKGRRRVPVAGHTAIVVDDGIATGATIHAALRAVRGMNPKQVILAVPVATRSALAKLASEVDALVCLQVPDDFPGVGAFYRDFHQVEDREVIALLDEAARRSQT